MLDSELTFFEKGKYRDVFITALAGPEAKKGYTAKAMMFDVPYVEDYNLKNLPFEDRQEILKELIPDELNHVDHVKTVKKGKKAYFQRLKRKGGEGVILKERLSPYREGERTPEWLKVKKLAVRRCCCCRLHGRQRRTLQNLRIPHTRPTRQER